MKLITSYTTLLTLISINLFSITYGGIENIRYISVMNYNTNCGTDFDDSDIDEVIQNDSGHDFEAYTVFLKNSGSVLVSRSLRGNREVTFHVDEVLCED